MNTIPLLLALLKVILALTHKECVDNGLRYPSHNKWIKILETNPIVVMQLEGRDSEIFAYPAKDLIGWQFKLIYSFPSPASSLSPSSDPLHSGQLSHEEKIDEVITRLTNRASLDKGARLFCYQAEHQWIVLLVLKEATFVSHYPEFHSNFLFRLKSYLKLIHKRQKLIEKGKEQTHFDIKESLAYHKEANTLFSINLDGEIDKNRIADPNYSSHWIIFDNILRTEMALFNKKEHEKIRRSCERFVYENFMKWVQANKDRVYALPLAEVKERLEDAANKLKEICTRLDSSSASASATGTRRRNASSSSSSSSSDNSARRRRRGAVLTREDSIFS